MMRRFWLNRSVDESGVSGTGMVAEGVEFSDGKCVMNWLTSKGSVAVYESIEDVEEIHGHGGRTRIIVEDKSVQMDGGELDCGRR